MRAGLLHHLHWFRVILAIEPMYKFKHVSVLRIDGP